MKRFLPILIFLTVAVVGLTMAVFAYLARQESTRIRFQATVDSAFNRIQTSMELHLSVLRATQAYFEARHGAVSPEEFRTYFEALEIDSNFAGLRGIGFVSLLKSGEEALATSALRQQYGLEVAIHPDTNEEYRAPIALYEPLHLTAANAIGFDMFSEPVRRDAIINAMKDTELHASGLIHLGQKVNAERSFPGFFVLTRLQLPSMAESTDGLPHGFLLASFRSAELFEVALRGVPLLPLSAEIYDERVSPDRLLYRSTTPPDAGSRRMSIRSMSIGDREWILKFRPTSSFSATILRADLIMLIVFTLLLAAAMALAIRYRERAYETTARLQMATETSLLEKDLMLQEMNHRNKNLISRIVAIARQTASGSASLADFSQSFNARMQAMSASLDMLTRSRWQRAELSELLRIELSQVFGKDLPEGTLSGPSLQLNEMETQALGLTFHELATNALKYGKAGETEHGLKVDWRTEMRDGASWLVLNWQESGLEHLLPPENPGFGTKLIDMSVTRELNGRVERRFLPSGLSVEILIPLSS